MRQKNTHVYCYPTDHTFLSKFLSEIASPLRIKHAITAFLKKIRTSHSPACRILCTWGKCRHNISFKHRALQLIMYAWFGHNIAQNLKFNQKHFKNLTKNKQEALNHLPVKFLPSKGNISNKETILTQRRLWLDLS